MKLKLGKKAEQDVYFQTDTAFNCHISLIGKSGSGKTAEAQKIMIEIAEQGGTVIALDLHQTLAPDKIFAPYRADFEKLLSSVDVYNKGFACEMFTPIKYADGSVEKSVDTVEAVLEMLSGTLHLGCNQQAALRAAVEYVMYEGFFATEGIAALGNALANIETKPAISVREKLYPIFSHNIFRNGKLPLVPRKINVLRLSKFSLGTQELVAELILSQIWRLAQSGAFMESRLFIFIDECQNLPAGEKNVLPKIITEGRQHGLNVILATQQLLPKSKSKVQQVIGQCDLKLFFQPDASQAKEVASKLDLCRTNEWILVLRNLKRGEFVAQGNLLLEKQLLTKPVKISAITG